MALGRRKLISENPFQGVKVAATGIKDRQRFISQEDIDGVTKACIDHNWRLMVALARYGGLRCPSEVPSLRWKDIDWEAGRVLVTSPNTEHYVGGGTRTIPLFPEQVPYLSESFELAPDGATYCIDERFRNAADGPPGWANSNLRTTFTKIIGRAGLESWPRPWHNLRASRETELVETYPVQVVTAWMGNTLTVAMRHYLMMTSEHFQHAAQKAAQQAHAGLGRDSHEPQENPRKRHPATRDDICASVHVGPVGLEPTTNRL